MLLKTRPQPRWLWPAALFATVTAVNLWSLMRIPEAFVDEAWLASRAWAFIRTGLTFGPLDQGVFDRFDGYWTFLPWLPNWIMGLPYRVTGQVPTLWPARLLSLGFGIVLLLAVYAIGCRLYGQRVGLLAVLITSLSVPFFASAHVARYDIFAATFGFTAIALYLYAGNRIWAGLLAGLLIGAAFESHPHSIMYGPVLVLLYYWDLRRRALHHPAFWAFLGGAAVGGIAYLALHVLPYPQTYFALNRIAFAPTHTPPLLTFNPGIILRGLVEMNWLIVTVYGIAMTAMVVWSFVHLALRPSPSNRKLFLLGACLIVGDALLIRNKADYYAILFSPALDLMIAAMLAGTFREWAPNRTMTYVTRAMAVLILVWFIGSSLWKMRQDSYVLYSDTQARVNQAVGPGETVLGSQTYWFGLYDHPYYSWEELVYYQRYAPGSNLEDAFAALRPTILIIDSHLRMSITPVPANSPYGQYLRMPSDELAAFLQERGRLIAEFEAQNGPVEIYRITWE